MAPNEVEVTAASIESASRPLAAADGVLEAYGSAVSQAALNAAGAAGDGPLGAALEVFAENAAKRAKERGVECRELSQSLIKTLAAFRENETAGAASFEPPSFGGVTG